LITIRRIRTGEADLLKQVRLASLRDAPYAFGATYDLVSQRSEEDWRERAESTAHGNDKATFFVFDDSVLIGMTTLFRTEDQAEIAELVQVWIAPEYRGSSTGRDLMDFVFQWARENNFRRIIAGVTNVNARALKFYIKYGFSVITESLPNDSEGVSLVKEVKRG
jgi:RimJ/RimL family protein N-acetyltransferase